ncbi:MAG: hypothetical protein KGZ88_20080 [Methylomicrobium sp.]|nr:hypothetical protein [Methylomicrobium sp.]
MKKRRQISLDEAKRIGDSLYIDWEQVDLEQFHQGLIGNHKGATMDPEAGLIHDGVIQTGKAALAHMQEFPDYFTRLEKLRAEMDERESRGR